MAVRIVVDSTADIPATRARELGITSVPLNIHFGDESFQDGVTLDAATFYRRLSTSTQQPTTSTPSPALFDQTFRSLITDGASGILALHVGSDLSGSYSVSSLAAAEVTAATGVPIQVIDSRSVSAGFGLPAEMVAREAREGASLDQLAAHAQSLFARVHLLAVLDTLEYLRRGGRIGGAQALFGTLLSMKPLIEVRDAKVLPVDRVRTRSKAQERIGQMIAALGPLEAVAIAESDDVVGAQIEQVARSFWNGPIEHFTLGPVVGTHAGPGASAIVAITRA